MAHFKKTLTYIKMCAILYNVKWLRNMNRVGIQYTKSQITFCYSDQVLYVTQVNPFDATGLFLYHLKTLENQSFSDVFRGYRKRPVAWYGLISKKVLVSLSIFTTWNHASNFLSPFIFNSFNKAIFQKFMPHFLPYNWVAMEHWTMLVSNLG